MTTPPTDSDRKTRYLRRALQLNPILESDQIVTLRAKFLRIKPPTLENFEDLRELRNELAIRLDRIRREFWKTEIEVLRRKLNALELDRFPDLDVAADRLHIVAVHRNKFGRLAEQGVSDGKFFSSLKTVLVAPARIADEKRHSAIESIRNSNRLKAVKRTLASIRSVMPEIYDLEHDWLDTIQRMKPKKRRASLGGYE